MIALGPRPGSVFVAHDYMTGLGTEIVRRDEIRLVEDTDGDGYADKSTVFAGGFNSIQGLAYHDGTVFVMHAPLLTALATPTATESPTSVATCFPAWGCRRKKTRRDCTAPTASSRGTTAGCTWRWAITAVDVARPEGDRLVLHGGGILRCRPDGRDLHVFATGLRNIYDVALDEELNVFVRDNENDGGDYMIRVCHSFLRRRSRLSVLYYERPDEALPPLADLGRGSSAGGVCYLETAFPPEYRGNLFFCEWGRSVVRYERRRLGSSFAPMKEIEFAAGAAERSLRLQADRRVVDRDGSLLVSDWGDGQRPKRGRGRLYRISYVGTGGAANPPIPKTNSATQPAVAQLDCAELSRPGRRTIRARTQWRRRAANRTAGAARQVARPVRPDACHLGIGSSWGSRASRGPPCPCAIRC